MLGPVGTLTHAVSKSVTGNIDNLGIVNMGYLFALIMMRVVGAQLVTSHRGIV
jgi:hypothetical protein